MTRPDDEFPPLDVTSTLNLDNLDEALEGPDADVAPGRMSGSLPPGMALLAVRRGPNAGARFLLDHDVTASGWRRPPSAAATRCRSASSGWCSSRDPGPTRQRERASVSERSAAGGAWTEATRRAKPAAWRRGKASPQGGARASEPGNTA